MKHAKLLAIVFVLLCLACSATPPENPVGIEVLGIQLLADGDVVRLNYRVVDYAVAKKALQKEVRLYREGADQPLGVLSVGRLGPLRQRPTRDGRPQFMIFMNGGRSLHKGDRALLAIGDARIAGIQVS